MEIDEDDDEPVKMGFHELVGLDLSQLKDGETLWVMKSEFPETTISRDGAALVAEITEHIYTKFWRTSIMRWFSPRLSCAPSRGLA